MRYVYVLASCALDSSSLILLLHSSTHNNFLNKEVVEMRLWIHLYGLHICVDLSAVWFDDKRLSIC